ACGCHHSGGSVGGAASALGADESVSVGSRPCSESRVPVEGNSSREGEAPAEPCAWLPERACVPEEPAPRLGRSRALPGCVWLCGKAGPSKEPDTRLGRSLALPVGPASGIPGASTDEPSTIR